MTGRYQPLPECNYFRLLNLHPAASEDPIVCTLHMARIPGPKSAPNDIVYEAVSYEWGPQSPEREIILDGWSCVIRDNLWQFLRHRRHTVQSLRLWIDALCINQKNLPERSSQVQWMGTIYRAAKRVLVWLGPARDDSDLAMDFINLGSSPHLMTKEHRTSYKALLRWAVRSYWSRTWIVQEFLLAKDQLLICGYKEADWNSIQRLYQRSEDIHSFFSTASWPGLTDFTESPAYVLFKQRIKGDLQQVPLSQLLINNQHSSCLDSRDKVYAMLSLATDCRLDHSIKVNYEKGVHSVFCDVMRFCEISSTDIFKYGHFVMDLLHIDSLSMKPNSSFPNTSRKLNAKSVLLSSRMPTTSTTVAQWLYAVGFKTGTVVCSDPLEQLNAAEVAGAKSDPMLDAAKSHQSGKLPLPSQALTAFLDGDMSEIMSKLERVDLRRLEGSTEILRAINSRSRGNVSRTTLTGPDKHQRFSYVVLYFSGYRHRTFRIGLAYGNVSKGENVVQFPGYATAFTVASLLAPNDEPIHITGKVLSVGQDELFVDTLTSKISQYHTLTSEAQLTSPHLPVAFQVTPEELLLLLIGSDAQIRVSQQLNRVY